MHVSALEEAQAFVTPDGSAIRELAKLTAGHQHREAEQPCVDDDTVLTGG
jgi:hypothetical protein